MTAVDYQNILATHMLPWARDKMAPNWIFQQDGDSKHMSARMTGKRVHLPDGRFVRTPGWFLLNCVRTMKWPSYSPDINPIENLWSIVKSKLRGKRFQNKEELWTAIQNAWNDIPIETCISLIDSLPNRINSIILARGGHTKY